MTDTVQNSAANAPISGSIVLTASDNLAFLFSRVSRLLLIAFLTSTTIAGVIWLLAMSNRQSAQLRDNPLLGLKTFVIDMFPVIFGYIGLFLAIIVFFSWLAFSRMPTANRQLTYHADAEALRTSDNAGAVLTLPWALVRRTRVTKKLLLMQLSTRAWRFLPLRAFAVDDQQRVIAFAQRSAATPGSAAKPDLHKG
jgi:hypothetical protein